jgi:hypothetical protein
MTVAARLIAELEARTSSFDSRIAASAVVMDKMTRSQVIAHRAMGQLRGSLQGLTMQAFGMIGPAGQAANSLLALAGGMTALVTAGAAGGVALMMLKVTKEIEEASKKSTELAASWRQLAAVRLGSPFLMRLEEQAPLQEARDEIQRQIDKRVAREVADAPIGVVPRSAAVLAEEGDIQLAEWLKQVDDLNHKIDEIARKPETILLGVRREVQLLHLPLEQSLRLQAKWAGLVGKTADEYVRLKLQLDAATQRLLHLGKFARGPATGGADVFGFGLPVETGTGTDMAMAAAGVRSLAMMGVGGETAPGAFGGRIRTEIMQQLIAQEERRVAIMALQTDQMFMANLAAAGLTEEFDAMVRAMTRTELKSQMLAVAIVTSVSSAIMAIAGGGGIGSILSGAGGVLGALATKHPSLLLPSVILGGLGGIFSAFDNSEEKRHRELLKAVQELKRPLAGPERVVNIFVNSRGEATAVAAALRDERRDARDRLGSGR